MTKNTPRKSRIKGSIYTMCIVSFFCGFGIFGEDFVARLDELIAPINLVIDKQTTDKIAFKNIVSSFCKSMTTGDPMIKEVDPSYFSYNGRNSIFMYRLCNDTLDDLNISRGPGLSDNAEKSYVRFEKPNQQAPEEVDILKAQLPDTFEHTAQYTQELFDTIIESYTNIFQASIYGKRGDDSVPMEELVLNFSKANFTAKGLADNEKYISVCATDKEYKYPKTCKKLTSYIKDAINSLNSSENIFNTTLLYEDIKKAKCDPQDSRYNTIACGLYGDDITKFVNLVYNELFFYTSFIQYYIYILDTQPQFKTSSSNGTVQQAMDRGDEMSVIRANLSDSRRAIKLSIRLLKELQMTFPMHIGFLMYTEGINTFVQKFNQTLIPIYTFGDIFRNVQDTQ